MASRHELIWAVFAAMLLLLLAGCGGADAQGARADLHRWRYPVVP